MLFTGDEAGPDGFRWAVHWLAVFFYANYGILASPRTALLQADLGILMGLFDRVVLQKNINKTVGMVCQKFQMARGHLKVAYQRRVTGL